MDQRPDVLRRVSWRDLCPWLLLLRAFPVSLGSVLLFGVLAAVMLPLGWRAAAGLLLTPEQREATWRFRGHEDFPGQRPPRIPPVTTPSALGHAVWDRVDGSFQSFAGSLRRVFGGLPARGSREEQGPTTGPLRAPAPPTARERAYWVCGGLWTLLIWSFFGGAVSRSAALQLGREEKLGLGAALVHARRRVGAYFFAPLFPLLALLVVIACCAVLGVLMRSDIGAVVAAVLWPLGLLGATFGTVLLLVVALGWPLLWGAPSCDKDAEAFDSVSHTFSFVLGRPLRLLFYTLFAALIGAAGWLVVAHAAQLTIGIAELGAHWGSAGRSAALVESDSNLARVAGHLIEFGNGLVWAALRGFEFTYFWTAAAGVYLLIRRDVDKTEVDEVFVDEEVQRFSLPPLQIDSAGVPQVAGSGE